MLLPRPALLASLVAICVSYAPLSSALNLQSAYQLARDNDPQLKAAMASRDIELEQQQQRKAALLPSINASANSDYADSSNSKLHNQRGYSINLNQPVYSPVRWHNYRQGEILDQSAQLTLDDAEQTLLLRTVTLYTGLLRAQNELATSEAQTKAIGLRLEQVQVQFDLGVSAITDLHEAQASYDDSQVALIEAQGDVETQREALERLIQQPVEQLDLLSDAYPLNSPEPSEPKAWVSQAEQQNLSLAIAQLQLEAAERGIRIAKSGHYPTLDLTASHGRNHNQGGASSGDRTDNRIGLTLSVPLYAGGGTQSQVRQAHAQVELNRQQLEDARRSVRQNTRSLLRSLRTNALSAKARRQSITSTRTALEATSEGFQLGTRTIVDVLQAEQNLYRAERNFAQLRLDYIDNLFSLKRQLGTLSPEDLIALDKWLVASRNTKP